MQFAQAMDVRQAAQAGANVDVSFRCATMADIWDAADTGAFTTAALTWTAISESEILKIIAELKQQGYGVTLGTGTITVTW